MGLELFWEFFFSRFVVFFVDFLFQSPCYLQQFDPQAAILNPPKSHLQHVRGLCGILALEAIMSTVLLHF